MSFLTKLSDYLKDSLSELKKVVWPTRKQTINYSLIVIGMSVGIAVFFAVLDFFFNWVLELLIK